MFLVMVVIMVVVAMIVPPGPIFLLLVWRQFLELPVRVSMGFGGPTVVVNDLVVVPSMVVRVVRVIGPIGVVSAGDACERRSQCSGQQQRTQAMRTTAHVVLL